MADYVVEAFPRMPAVDWSRQPHQVCHGDFHLDNLLYDAAGRVVAVLDFDNTGLWWTGVELMTAWNLMICRDPNEPKLTPEGHAFFSAYRETGSLPESIWADLPMAYWTALVADTWPADLRYGSRAAARSEWADLLGMRYRAAQWIEKHLHGMIQWLNP
jgi:Ser/Thr protein kinase RdoA (MazF antagonist)